MINLIFNLLYLSTISFAFRTSSASPLKSFLFSMTSSGDQPKLVYFDAKGVVELSRCMLKIGQIDFEDSRFPIKLKEGGGFETPEFAEVVK